MSINHSSLETLMFRLCVNNIAIRCKTLYNLMLVMCYSLNISTANKSQMVLSDVNGKLTRIGILELAYKVGLEYNIMFNVEKTKFINMDKDPNRVKDLHFNDISISACESGEHLGNWIGRNCNSSNIDRTITEFNCMVNYISSTFSFTPFDVKLQLFNTYCMPLYGSVLWDLSNKKCEEFYTQWRKALRKLLSLPKTTASNLIHHICNCHPIDNQLVLRFLKFMNVNFTSDNIKVRICGNLALQRSGSAASKTLQFLSQKFNVKCDSDLYGKFKKILRCPLVDHSENIISGLIRDTLYLRDYDHPYFTYQECNNILQFMCCQ